VRDCRGYVTVYTDYTLQIRRPCRLLQILGSWLTTHPVTYLFFDSRQSKQVIVLGKFGVKIVFSNNRRFVFMVVINRPIWTRKLSESLWFVSC